MLFGTWESTLEPDSTDHGITSTARKCLREKGRRGIGDIRIPQ
jgi:hypothetical protein